MLQRVFAHDLFEGKGIGAGLVEFCRRLDLDAMFIDIVHPAAQPAFFIGGQGKIIALAVVAGIAGLVRRALSRYYCNYRRRYAAARDRYYRAWRYLAL